MTYRLHYTSADRQGDDSPWSVYSEEYTFPEDAVPLEDSTVHLSTWPTEGEADAEANRLQEESIQRYISEDPHSGHHRRLAYAALQRERKRTEEHTFTVTIRVTTPVGFGRAAAQRELEPALPHAEERLRSDGVEVIGWEVD